MRNPDLTKEKILHQSGLLFNKQGYKATSISNITDATGFTKGAIYRHFKNKEALEKESLFYLSSLMFEKVRLLIKSKNNAGDKLRALFNYFEEVVTNPPIAGGCPLLNVAIEVDDSNPALRKEAHKLMLILKDSVINILNNGIKYKQLKPEIDKELYATLIIASLEGGIMMSKLSQDNKDIKRIVKHLTLQIKEIEL